MTGRRIAAATTLALTVVVVVTLSRGAPGTAHVTSGHDHGAAPDPATTAVLLINVVVLVTLAMLARRHPPGVRRPGKGGSRWTYREPAAASRRQPSGPRVHSSVE